MIQDARKRLLVRVGLGVGAVLAILLLWLVFRASPAPTAVPPQEDGAVPSANTETPAVPVAPAARTEATVPGTPEEIYLKQISRDFVERYGSYSNQNDNTQIMDAMALASDRMKAYLRTKTQEFSADYTGATTNVVASSIVKRDDATAEVRVDVQRTIFSAGAQTMEYQTGTVKLVKNAAGEWKVDGLYWE
jgi:hypothetical protein